MGRQSRRAVAPLRRGQEIANAALFLASDDASFRTAGLTQQHGCIFVASASSTYSGFRYESISLPVAMKRVEADSVSGFCHEAGLADTPASTLQDVVRTSVPRSSSNAETGRQSFPGRRSRPAADKQEFERTEFENEACVKRVEADAHNDAFAYLRNTFRRFRRARKIAQSKIQ
jgi:hypothetical protein